MSVERISDLQAFVAVVEQGGVTAAARHLGRSVQAVSRSLATVERAVGVELVRRTTRNSNPTAAGAGLYRRVASALSDIEAASAEAAGARDKAIGVLRVSASTRFAPAFVVPAVASFLAAHPAVEVDLSLEDRHVDLVREGHDVAVRLGDLPDSSLKARRLAALRQVTFAAPGYLAARGRPAHPQDLASHSCIVRTSAHDGAVWTYTISGQLQVVTVRGPLKTNNADAANRAALEGVGIANAPYWQVQGMVENGGVELLLTAFEPPDMPVHAVWAHSEQVPAKTRLFVDHLAAYLRPLRL